MKKSILILLLAVWAVSSYATVYRGRVVDDKGRPVSYATVYPEIVPEVGTATNNDGYFSFESATLPPKSKIIVSFIGYEKQVVTAAQLSEENEELTTVTLNEQPIALEETVVAAKKSKQRNKRKEISSLLYAVYQQIEKDFPDDNIMYSIVSDVKMLSEGDTWGMEQMIANMVVMPEQAKEGRDSVQVQGRYCKRFFSAEKRAQADSILAGETIERLEKNSKEKFMRRAVNAVDSGVVVHQALFAMGNMRYDFEQAINDYRHWSVSNESEGETVLTHTEKIVRYLGFFQMTFKRHYIVDSRTYAVRRFSEHAEVKIIIPFGYKLNADQLQMLNLLNMSEKQIEKFRIKRMTGAVDYNTLYQRRDEHVYVLEKNMVADALISGTKKAELPVVIRATQHVVDLRTQDVQPLSPEEITRRLERQIVEIY